MHCCCESTGIIEPVWKCCVFFMGRQLEDEERSRPAGDFTSLISALPVMFGHLTLGWMTVCKSCPYKDCFSYSKRFSLLVTMGLAEINSNLLLCYGSIKAQLCVVSGPNRSYSGIEDELTNWLSVCTCLAWNSNIATVDRLMTGLCVALETIFYVSFNMHW